MNVNLLKSKLLILNKSTEDLAMSIGINKATLYRKLRGDTEFTRKEIDEIRSILKLNQDELYAIFFSSKSCIYETK